MIEESSGGGNADLMSEVAADRARTASGIIRLTDSRKQQQAGVVERPGSEEDKRGGLEHFLTPGVDIRDAASGRFGGVHEHSANPGAGSECNVLAFLNDWQKKIGRLRFCAGHTAKARAKPAIG